MPRIVASKVNECEFDFIIIGGGTAGCVLANRLSANGEHSVLILEAGEDTQEENLNSQIPLFHSKLKNTSVDWKFKSSTQSKADHREIGIPLGKMLGGSSGFNACLLHRCSPSDYDAWETKGWYYDDLKPYFRKAETLHDDKQLAVDPNVHGTSGPLNVTLMNQEDSSLNKSFRKACQDTLGLPYYRDMTDLTCQIGVTELQATIYHGQRSSTGSSYLPISVQQSRPNLSIALGCNVSKIVLDDRNETVSHVEFFAEQDKQPYQVKVKREVILSAGAILSPYLLMLSGIGPKSELEQVGVDVVKDLPGVGKNLQNHWRVPLVHETTDPSMSLHHDLFVNEKETLSRALLHRDGALTQLWPDAVAYMKVPDTPDNSSNIENTPQIEVFTGGLALCKELSKLKHIDCATLLTVYLAPFSTGSVTLSSDKKSPTVDFGLLEDERDLQVFKKGLEISMKIANEPSYKDKCVKRWIIYPENDNIEGYIKKYADTIHHYAGTCKMGQKEDKSTVVDERLRVHGIRNLRVCDASFFPRVPAGQICFPVIACAERASDIILEDNKPCI